jgi:hypothetical protein
MKPLQECDGRLVATLLHLHLSLADRARVNPPVPQAILFERRGTRLGYRLLCPIPHISIVDAPELNSDLATLSRDLEKILIHNGLYPNEAHAFLNSASTELFAHQQNRP